MALLMTLFFLLCPSSLLCSMNCQWKPNNIQNYMATKTPYRFVANRDSSSYSYEGCTPVKFWALIRHGTRNPSSKVIVKMNKHLPVLRDAIVNNFEAGKGYLCKEQVQNISQWKPHLTEVDASRLAHEGEDELLELGERFQMRFPALLPEIYSNSSYKFRFTATQRTLESARHFAIGLFGRKVSRYVWFPDAIYRDPILRFYKSCERWQKSVNKNPDALSELHKFLDSQQMYDVRRKISTNLGLDDVITYDNVKLIYLMCSFETAWRPYEVSPWCSLLSNEDLEVLEYAEDLDHYWIDGYGYKINHEQACPPMKDMFSFFRSHREVNSSAELQAVLYFSHAGTVLKMLAHLGVYQDEEPLRADNFNVMLGQRQWRASRITAFASNIAFVLYGCGSEDKILFLHQERPVRLPGCPDSHDLCPLGVFREKFLSSVDQCNFEDLCAWKVNQL